MKQYLINMYQPVGGQPVRTTSRGTARASRSRAGWRRSTRSTPDRHLGIRDLSAGCEVSNVASRRWLAACGFVPAEGPPTHVLPDGRVIEAMWWRHSDERSRRRCRSFQAPGMTILFG
ncbi:hypothetical protein ABGB16_18560 [Micromonospora sp. B11E3]|uniref:hypothetical protein n=1 Tax=Micromonospora sp. B11E3 TaxID=3153562 RepID=UPI00325CC669